MRDKFYNIEFNNKIKCRNKNLIQQPVKARFPVDTTVGILTHPHFILYNQLCP